VLGLKANHLVNTPAFDLEFQESAENADNLFRMKVLAYSTSRVLGKAMRRRLKVSCNFAKLENLIRLTVRRLS